MYKRKITAEENAALQQLKADIDVLLKNNMPKEALQLIRLQKTLLLFDLELATIFYLLQIDAMERIADIPSLFTKVNNSYDAIERYTCLKFLLRRIEYDMPGALDTFCEYHAVMNFSMTEIQQITALSCISGAYVIARIEEVLKYE